MRPTTPPEIVSDHGANPGDLPGAFGGSRLFERPEHAWEAQRWQAFLERPGPALLEVGFDHGRRLTHTAAHHRDWKVLGLEVRRQRVDQMEAWAAQHHLDNLLVWRCDARVALARFTPADSVDIIEALFPDPWWKAAHRQRRALLSPSFLQDCARVTRPGGILHLATDVPQAAEHIDALLTGLTSWRSDPDAACRRPTCHAQSRREWRCHQDGTPVFRWWLVREQAATDPPRTGHTR